MKRVLFTGVIFLGLILSACSAPFGSPLGHKEITYYYETGGVSETAYNLINGNPGLSPQQVLAYCHQYPVPDDIYKEAKSGYTRTELENDLDELEEMNIPNFSKTQFLYYLDIGGVICQLFLIINEDNQDMIYYYVEKE